MLKAILTLQAAQSSPVILQSLKATEEQLIKAKGARPLLVQGGLSHSFYPHLDAFEGQVNELRGTVESVSFAHEEDIIAQAKEVATQISILYKFVMQGTHPRNRQESNTLLLQIRDLEALLIDATTPSYSSIKQNSVPTPDEIRRKGNDKLGAFLAALKMCRQEFNADPVSCFFSYAWENQAFVKFLADHLELAGVQVILDIKDGPDLGRDLTGLEKQILQVDKVLVFGSEAYRQKADAPTASGVKDEVPLIQQRYAQKTQDVITVLLQETPQLAFPAPLDNPQIVYADCKQAIDYFQRVFQILERLHDAFIETHPSQKAFIAEQKRFFATSARGLSLPKRNSMFTGRKELFTEIDLLLQKGQQVAIVGLGGMGKSSLALEYLHRNSEKYIHTFWLNAEILDSSLRNLGEYLGVIGSNDSTEEVILKVRVWLEANPGWLIVFDNAKDISQLESVIPSKGGTVLITSRSQSWPHKILLDTLSPEDSVALLVRITGRDGDPALPQLAEALGYLPLALTQAGAYILQKNLTISKYLKFYQDQREALWEKEATPKDYPHTVAATWNLSLQELKQQSPNSLAPLYLSAFLAPDNIPESLLMEPGQTPFDLEESLQPLRGYSFFTPGGEEDTLSIHRLVQSVIRDHLTPEETAHLLDTLYASFKIVWVFGEKNTKTWPITKRLRSHLEALLNLTPENSPLLERKAYYLNDLGTYRDNIEVDLGLALQYKLQALAIRRKVLGEKHPDVAGSLNNLGITCYSQGDYPKAIRYFGEAFEIRKEVYGEEHPDVASSLNSLGTVFYALGESPKAIDFYNQALVIRKKILGDEHLSVATSLNNLGGAFESLGDTSLAIECHTQALAIWRKVLGEEHPSVAKSLNNLGEAFYSQREYPKAIDYYNQALVIKKKVLGEEHPSVATSLHNLGMAFYSQGGIPRAIYYLAQALAIRKKLLGEEHPDYKSTLKNLNLAKEKSAMYLRSSNLDPSPGEVAKASAALDVKPTAEKVPQKKPKGNSERGRGKGKGCVIS